MTDYIEFTSNPMAPDSFVDHEEVRNHKLSNSDFRKLLMTPRPVAVPPTATDDLKKDDSMHPPDKADRKHRDTTGPTAGGRPKHKRHHGRQHRRDQAKESAAEPTPRYRDRAKERRDGKLVAPSEEGADERDYEQDEEALSRTADYRAVAPTSAAGQSLAERRRMLIQESKYLGGDMEHTHLVKGLDYVLLQKVRLEIQNKELEAEKVLDAELSKPEVSKDRLTTEDGVQFRTKLAAGIFDALFNLRPPERNEYFQPGRMAYRIELEDDSVDFEVPATVIRSKADCLQTDGRGSDTITTNEIVINKLTQILSYLRAGKRHAKKAKLRGRYGEKDEELGVDTVKSQANSKKVSDEVIFDNVGSNYVPTVNRRAQMPGTQSDHMAREKQSTGEEAGTRRPRPSYFEVPDDADAAAATDAGNSVNATKEFMQELNQRFNPKDDEKVQEKASLERFFEKTKVTCYDECYPGFAESYDAMGDSDDEADFSKMDLGNKKGPVGRWDFETQEEYSDYMSHKEALPKAAFQYGVKMADGRRTRRIGPKDEKAELDRQLQKIQSIIQKRKQLAEDVGPMAKNPHY
ncbi:Protein Red [Clonorchis sinensis]|uniref:Protein Red n=2 Tax=Clonorchis sinensis TaxID=79923 RepID=A0A8T1MAL1_CLOSI|nr:Protein Red [Clonorchis sinensis]GAA56182.1 IK cytokine [Clonorchis sinensis]